MSFESFETRDTESEVRHHIVRMVGTGAAAPTWIRGKGLAITRDGVGIYTLTWRDNPGEWIGPAGESFNATVSANVKGCSVSWGVYSAATKSVQFKVWDVTGTARELAALEWLTVDVMFQLTGP